MAVDTFSIRCTYKPSKPITLMVASIRRTVTSVPSYSKGATYVPAYNRAPALTVARQ